MKFLLTSGGITNGSIRQALQDLAGKSLSETKIAFIPTAGLIESGNKDWLIDDLYRIKETGAEIDIVDIAQLREDEWLHRVEEADVIFVGGGNSFYLSYVMQKSSLMARLPELLKTKVYAGISAGSMIVGDSLRVASQAIAKDDLADDEYDELGPRGRSSAETAQLVKLVVRPHLNSRFFPNITGEKIRKVAQGLHVPIYAIDDQTAIKVVDDQIEVVSEGTWQIFENENDRIEP